MSVTPMNRSSIRAPRTAIRILVAAGLVGVGLAAAPSGCATQTTIVPTRALERSGRTSFVCLADPKLGASALRPITDCNATTVVDINDYTYTGDDAGAPQAQPHLYALVTQTTRGEVAVIDTTATNNPVLDQDPTVPGANFLPIGAQPIDIVSTPGGTATFVGVAEIGREGLFALPSSRIRPASAEGAGGAGGGSTSGPAMLPEISAWPSCRLPAAPGQMLLIADPAGVASSHDKAATRPCCDAQYGAQASVCQGGAVDHPNGNIEDEDQGKSRQKLVVAMPSMGGVAVIDAQTLLDATPGAYAPCVVERWLPLSTDVPVLPVAPPPDGTACVNPTTESPVPPAEAVSRPTGLAYAGGRLYASDLASPLIHVIDLPTPCEPVETKPLLPTSVDDPKRVVKTTHVAVAPSPTPDLKRYLYALDDLDGSAMVFDVSDDQASPFPLRRPHPEWDPFAPSDRIVFAAPAADLLIVQRDVPEVNPVTGVALEGVRCDPRSTKTCGDPKTESCDIGTSYRTNEAYTIGAGPLKLRGTFAFLALTSGRVAVIDIDDYDAPCRGPASTSSLFGCQGPQESGLKTTDELSCNVVLPNSPRMGTYYAAKEAASLHQSGIQSYPQLFDLNGAPIEDTDPRAPHLVATQPVIPAGETPPVLQLSVGGTPIALDGSGKVVEETLATKSTLLMNLEDPRAHLVDQNWFVVYEGALPGFSGRLAGLHFPAAASEPSVLSDVSSRFCDAGVQSQKAAIEKYGATDPNAASLADYVQLQTELPDQADAYWTSAKKDEHGKDLTCDFNVCRTIFGSVDVPDSGRSYTILEARQDEVEITPRDPKKFSDNPGKKGQDWRDVTRCCFPSLVSFDVRVGNQWEVAGDQSGFLHHVIADPATGACRESCDPKQARRNGRALRVPSTGEATAADVADGGKFAFINPMFRFFVQDPPLNASNKAVPPLVGQQFRFTTLGAFKPLIISLASDGTLIQPVGMAFVPATGQIAVTDGSINGLLLVDLSSSSVSRPPFQ